MLADKPTELSRIKLKNLNSTARPYDICMYKSSNSSMFGEFHLFEIAWQWSYLALYLGLSKSLY